MPITVKIANHEATPWTEGDIASSIGLLEKTSPRHWRRCQRLVQSSFNDSELSTTHVSPSENGLVYAAWHAYSKHHHLVLRPEDVWFSILAQLSFYINAHAEELRSFFVDHEGQEELEAISEVADFGALAVQMTELMGKKVVDPGLREWVAPSFSTTTHDDTVVGAVLFMGAMQKYFSFGMMVTCGLPSVTLLGSVDDWRDILQRLDKIDQLGEEPKHFANMLRPILTYMVMTFEHPASAKVDAFWNRIVHHNYMGSGTDYLSGWLTAFCYWDEEGTAKRPSEDLNIDLFRDKGYPIVFMDAIPVGYASVPVKVNDMGHQFDATMVAGLVGIAAAPHPGHHQPSPSEDTTESGRRAPVRDALQPVSGWWMYENEAPGEAEARTTEMKQLQQQIDQYKAEIDGLRPSDYERQWELYLRMSPLSLRFHELEAY
ncbi:hypothetical protein MBLNU230_g7936t1 [Neophaeotheca triangularis]